MLIGVVLVVLLCFIAMWNGWIGYMPPIEDLQNPISRYASQIYSSDGKVMGTWNFNRENRVMVDYKSLTPDLVHALVATEDERFYEHSGIDFIALGRAIVKRGFMRQASAGGGSTITQQLAKQLYSETAHSTLERLIQKPVEWVIAIKLERHYTKEEIITMYLNYFDSDWAMIIIGGQFLPVRIVCAKHIPVYDIAKQHHLQIGYFRSIR